MSSKSKGFAIQLHFVFSQCGNFTNFRINCTIFNGNEPLDVNETSGDDYNESLILHEPYSLHKKLR